MKLFTMQEVKCKIVHCLKMLLAFSPWQLLVLLIASSQLLIASKAQAQDIHFTQYFANPISLNPATTGYFKGNYRLGVNHKSQWPWAIDQQFINYNTSSAYADFTMQGKKYKGKNWSGVGLNFTNDQAGDGNLKANKIYLALAYHLGLDDRNKHMLSFGMQGGYVIRSIDFGALYFNNQWQERVGFNLSIPSNEPLRTEFTGYFDIGVGMQGRNTLSEKISVGYGYSLLHINRPTETFYAQENKLGLRQLLHVQLEYRINQRVDLMGSGYFTTQKKAHEILFGALTGIKTSTNTRQKQSKIYVGAFYRAKDAISGIVGYQYHTTRFLFNYDVNLSKLTKASKGNGGFEISLVHTGQWRTGNKGKTYCPDF